MRKDMLTYQHIRRGKLITKCDQVVQKAIQFEHPMNEEIRIFLCLESLFSQLNTSIQQQQPHTSIITLLKIINVLDRPDIKTKICQRLNLYATSLSQLKQFPSVDSNKLVNILNQIDNLKAQMHQQTSRLGEQLKRNEFLNQLRQHLNFPGGLAYHNTFALTTWAHLPPAQQLTDIIHWRKELTSIESTIQLILKLTRQTAANQQQVASNGYFQKNLDTNLPIGLIIVRTQYHTYPEFSATRHRLNIRFMQPNYYDNAHPKQTQEDIPFTLSCCQI